LAAAPGAEASPASVQAYSCNVHMSGGLYYAGHYSGNSVVPSATSVTSAGIEAQCLLRYIGYYTDTVDGIFGSHSQAAMKTAQRTINALYDQHLTVDGFPGPKSWVWLRTLPGG
jgi:hypothetical protein